MDLAFIDKIWDRWASNSVGSSGKPLRAAILINYDPTAPSRLLSTVVEQEGIKADPAEVSEFIKFIKRNNLKTESFVIGPNQYVVTSIHESWFGARCLNSLKAAGEGAIVMQTPTLLLIALYEGSLGTASRAMSAADQIIWQLGRKSI